MTTPTTACSGKNDDGEHRSQDQTLRHYDDQVLRAAGYRIWMRARNMEAVWQGPSGKLWTQADALEEVLGKELGKAPN
jgi:hypothetical protein